MKKIGALIVAVVVSHLGFGNHYKWKAEIDSVTEAGFYKIPLDSAVTTRLNSSFSDIRIRNAEDKEVPYLFNTEKAISYKTVFKEYKIERIKHYSLGTEVIILNEKQQSINNFSLHIKNFQARKKIKLSGSDDGEMWYTVKESYSLYSANSRKETHSEVRLNFPNVDYKYLRLLIFDFETLPVNILKAGYYETKQEWAKYQPLPQPKITLLDSIEEKKTYLKVSFNNAPYFDRIKINVEGVEHYNRKAEIAIKKTDTRGYDYFQTMYSFTLNSNTQNVFSFQNFQLGEFYTIIENQDNPPLTITEIQPYQLSNYLVAYLKPNQQYSLFVGDKAAKKPQYDIGYFTNKMPETLPIAQANNLKENEIETVKTPVEDYKKYLIWAAIIAAMGVLGLVSVKMMKEVN